MSAYAYLFIVLATVCFSGQHICYERVQSAGPRVSPSIIMLADISVVLVGLLWFLRQPQSLASLTGMQWAYWAGASVLLALGMFLMLSGYRLGASAVTAGLIIILIAVWIPIIQWVTGIITQLHWMQITAFVLGVAAVFFAIFGDPKMRDQPTAAVQPITETISAP